MLLEWSLVNNLYGPVKYFLSYGPWALGIHVTLTHLVYIFHIEFVRIHLANSLLYISYRIC